MPPRRLCLRCAETARLSRPSTRRAAAGRPHPAALLGRGPRADVCVKPGPNSRSGRLGASVPTVAQTSERALPGRAPTLVACRCTSFHVRTPEISPVTLGCEGRLLALLMVL